MESIYFGHSWQEDKPLFKLQKLLDACWAQSSKHLAGAALFASNHIACSTERSRLLNASALVKVTLEIEGSTLELSNETKKNQGRGSAAETNLLTSLQRCKKWSNQVPEERKERVQKALKDGNALVQEQSAAQWKEVFVKVRESEAKLKPLALGMENGKCWKEHSRAEKDQLAQLAPHPHRTTYPLKRFAFCHKSMVP